MIVVPLKIDIWSDLPSDETKNFTLGESDHEARFSTPSNEPARMSVHRPPVNVAFTVTSAPSAIVPSAVSTGDVPSPKSRTAGS